MRIVMIGHGMVGHRFLENLSKKSRQFLTKSSCWPKSHVLLMTVCNYRRFFNGKTAEDLSVTPHDFFENTGYGLQLNTRATHIDSAAKTVTTVNGDVIHYDKLILATGSYPFVPPVQGNNREGCLVYRTIEDLHAIRDNAA
jgi:nitrite reductase (NADH) large subunit